MTSPGTADRAAAPSSRRASVLRDALPWLVITAAFVHALAVSWRKWGDVSVDTGRELDLPRRLAEGQLLYRDARFYYGPLAPYVNALLYRIFGVHLDVLVWAGIFSAALMCVALYRLGRFFVPRWASTMIVLAFIYLCAFAHLYVGPIFNFVLPYTFSATYGIVVATWSLVLLIQHIRSGRILPFCGSAALLALAALSKLEVFAPAAAVHAVFVVSLIVERPRRSTVYFATYGAAVACVLALYGALALSVGPGLWRENLFGVVNRGSREFVLWAMGLANPLTAFRAVAASALLMTVSFGAAWLAAWLLRRNGVATWTPAILVAGLAVLSFVVVRYWQLHVHFRALPVVMVVAIITLAVVYWKQPQRRSEWLSHLLLWVFGFAALWRIVLNVRPQHYGFYLLPVGLVCLVVLFVDYGPRAAVAGPWPRRFFGATALGFLASSALLAFVNSRELYAMHTYELTTPRGTLRIPNRWRLEVPAIRALSRLPQDTRAVALPQGAGLLYFAGLREGDTMSSYLPMEIAGDKADRELLARWSGNPPDVFVFVAISLEEFGSAGIGVDYARRALEWVRREYVPVTNPSSPIVIMRRRQQVTAETRFLDLSPSPAPTRARQTVTGRVVDTFDSEGATLLEVRTATSTTWVAILQTKVPVGSTVTVVDALPVSFEEMGLRRRSDRILGGRLASPPTPEPLATAPDAPHP